MNKPDKTKLSLKFIEESLIYLSGDETANHVNFLQPMLISYTHHAIVGPLEGDIRKESKISTSGNYPELGFILYQPEYLFRPVLR